MKKVKKFFYGILKFLGITSLITACGGEVNFGAVMYGSPQVDMYGMPPNYKSISGVVYGDTDGDGTEETVNGIEVTVTKTDANSETGTETETFKTLIGGHYSGGYYGDDPITISFKDVDGEENGSFEEQTITINWEDGNRQTKDIHLKRKDDQNTTN